MIICVHVESEARYSSEIQPWKYTQSTAGRRTGSNLTRCSFHSHITQFIRYLIFCSSCSFVDCQPTGLCSRWNVVDSIWLKLLQKSCSLCVSLSALLSEEYTIQDTSVVCLVKVVSCNLLVGNWVWLALTKARETDSIIMMEHNVDYLSMFVEWKSPSQSKI